MAFGKEIKEFLAAMATTQKMVSSFGDNEYKRLRAQLLKSQIDKANDPERRALDLGHKQAQINRLNRGPALHPSVVGVNESKKRYYDLLQENAKNPPKAPSAADSAVPAYPVEQGRTVEPEGDAPLDDGTAGEDTLEFRRGGAVPAYAEGGAVEDDLTADVGGSDTDEDDDPTVTAQGNGPGYSPLAAHDAARDGIQYAMSATGAEGGERQALDEVTSQARPRATRSAYLARSGAASHDEMEAVRKAIDPQGRMTESQRNMAALAHVYEYNLKQNNPDGAKRAAASMMQYFGLMSGRYQALAKVAAESGDVDGAVKNMLKAHANIPDGMDLRVVKTPQGIAYTYMDEATGKTYEKGIMSPEQILSFATKGAQTSMENFVAQAAGVRAGGGRTAGTKGEKTPAAGRKYADRENPMNEIDTEAERKGKDGKPLYTIPEQLSGGIKHVASQILSENDVPSAEALQIAGAAATGAEGYTIADGVVTTPEGRKVRISKDGIDNLAVLRARAKRYKDAAGVKAEAKRVEDEKLSAARTRALEHETTLPARADAAALQRVKDENAARRQRQAVPIE